MPHGMQIRDKEVFLIDGSLQLGRLNNLSSLRSMAVVPQARFRVSLNTPNCPSSPSLLACMSDTISVYLSLFSASI